MKPEDLWMIGIVAFCILFTASPASPAGGGGSSKTNFNTIDFRCRFFGGERHPAAIIVAGCHPDKKILAVGLEKVARLQAFLIDSKRIPMPWHIPADEARPELPLIFNKSDEGSGFRVQERGSFRGLIAAGLMHPHWRGFRIMASVLAIFLNPEPRTLSSCLRFSSRWH